MTRGPRLILASALALLIAACSTRVVDLALPDSGNPGNPADAGATIKPDAATGSGAGTAPDAAVSCEAVKRADGVTCRLCFGADGTVVNGTCDPVMTVPPPPAVPDAAPGIPMCKVIPRGDLRCRECSSAAGVYTACLTCQDTVVLGGERCRPCAWSDLPEQRCLQCFGADGGVSHDDCDAFRKEVVSPGGM